MQNNNLRSKILSLVLSMTLIITMIPVTAFAESEINESSDSLKMYMEDINPLYSDEDTDPIVEVIDATASSLEETDATSNSTDSVDYVDTTEEAGNQLRNCMVERETNPTISVKVDELSDDVASSTVEEIFNIAIQHTGKPNEGDSLKWVYEQYSSEITGSSDGTNYYIVINFDITYYTTAEQEDELTTAVENLKTELALDGKTDYEIVKAIYDYMTANIEYDYTNLNDDSHKLKYTAYAALVNKTSVCQGYATLFYRMACEYGIDARVIAGTSLNNQGETEAHSWNIVKLGGKYYNLDATWDSTTDTNYDNHDYFLKGSNNFSDHERYAEYLNEEFTANYLMSESDFSEVVEDSWESFKANEFKAGDGSALSPYEISTPEELALMAYNVNANIDGYTDANYVLTDNIDLSNHEWVPIGICTYDSNENSFKGSFNGNNFSIRNMNISREMDDCVSYGLFGTISNGTVENVDLIDSHIDFESTYVDPSSEGDQLFEKMIGCVYVGTLAGRMAGSVKNCTVDSFINVTAEGASLKIGGVSGEFEGDASNIYVNIEASVDVIKGIHFGGIFGVATNTTIENFGVKGTASVKNDGEIPQYSAEEGVHYACHVGGVLAGTGGCPLKMKNGYSFVDLNVESKQYSSAGRVVGNIISVTQPSLYFENIYCMGDVRTKCKASENKEKESITAFWDTKNDIGSLDELYVKNCGILSYDRFYKIQDLDTSSVSDEDIILQTLDLTEVSIEELFTTILEFDPSIWDINNETYPTITGINDVVEPVNYSFDTISGNCGDNITWKYGNNGVLVLEGTGDMHDFNGSDLPWWDFRDQIYEVCMDDSITRLGDYAFYVCDNLYDIEMPEDLESIGNFALMGSHLQEIYFPANVSSLGQEAVSANKYVTKFVVDENNKTYFSENGVLFDSITNSLVQYPAMKEEYEYAIPNEVEHIEINAFKNCAYLKNLTLSKGMDCLIDFSFNYNYSIENIVIPATINSISSNAFDGCYALKKLYFNGEMPEFADGTFEGLTLNIHYLDVHEWDLTKVQAIDGTISWIEDIHSHEYTSVVTEPTCTETGYTTYTCECGDTYTADEVEKLGHKEKVTKAAKEPTCAEAGWTEEISCERCNEFLIESEEIPATGHTWNSSYTVDKKATATKNGSKSIHCADCDATKDATAIYYPKKVKLSTTSYTYNGKVKKPTVKVYDSNGKLIAASNYTVKYATGRKNVGKYKVTVTFKSTSKYYSGSKYTTFKIDPKGTTLSTVTKGKKAFTAKWKKQTAKMAKTRITGYQIRYSTSAKMTNAKIKTVKGYNKNSLKVSNLKANKKYYVQVRTYKIVNGTKYYSTWSKYKTVKTKK